MAPIKKKISNTFLYWITKFWIDLSLCMFNDRAKKIHFIIKEVKFATAHPFGCESISLKALWSRRIVIEATDLYTLTTEQG